MDESSSHRLATLEGRIERLEAELSQLRRDTTPFSSALPPPPPVPFERTAVPPPLPHPGPPSVPFESETVLKWGGVALVVLAVGFAVSTAISRGWIGPVGQLVGAVAVSGGLIAVGLRLFATRPRWTHPLCMGGVVGLFSTAASDLFIEQLGESPAAWGTVAIGVLGVSLARFVPSEWVAASALLGGTVAWLVVGDGEAAFVPTTVWVALLVTATIVLAVEQRWFGVRVLGHGVGLIGFLALAEEAAGLGEQTLLLAVASVLVGSLARVPSIGDGDSEWQVVDLQLAAVIGPWALGLLVLTFDIETDPAAGLIGLAVAAALVGTALALRPVVVPAHFMSLLVGASVALSIGLGLVLSTEVAFVAVAVQGLGLLVLARTLGGSLRLRINGALLLVLGGAFALGSMVDAWRVDAAIGDDVANLAIIAAIAATAVVLHDPAARSLVASGVLGLLLVWLGSVLVHLPEGQAAVSASWAVVGTAVLVAGAVRKVPGLGAAGLSVLALTVGKLLTVDLREVDALWRAGLFFFVGLGLLRLGFLLPRLTEGTANDHEPPVPVTQPV